jgi:hypothetical protein
VLHEQVDEQIVYRDFVYHDLLVLLLRFYFRRCQFQAVQRALACTSFAAIAGAPPILAL